MTDDQQRRIDGLLASYGEMRATLERLDERVIGQADDIAAQREALREAVGRMETALVAVGKTCEQHTNAVRLDVREQGQEIRKLTAAQRWTPTQWAAILGPTLTALIGAAAIVLSKGSP